CDSRPVFPAGLEVLGTISKIRKVGLGFIHDSAYVEIQFNHLFTAAGQALPFTAEVVEVDNAREAVRHGVFRGIRATNAPQGRITTRSGKESYVVTLLIVGSQEQVEDAFTAAGWRTADANSKNAFFKEFGAFLTSSNYPNMPVSRQLLSGQLQDMAWQKSFNSYGKREHLRLWSQSKTVQGEQAWLSAYTREAGAALSVKYHKFIHHIDRNLDDGINMLVRHLALTGCVESVRQRPRT